jgi:hypothetical protein
MSRFRILRMFLNTLIWGAAGVITILLLPFLNPLRPRVLRPFGALQIAPACTDQGVLAMNYPIDMKPDRIRWKRTKGRQQLLLNKIYDAVTEEFTRDAMASLATVLAHLCIVTDVAKPEAIEAFGNAFDEARDMLSGSGANASLLN